MKWAWTPFPITFGNELWTCDPLRCIFVNLPNLRNLQKLVACENFSFYSRWKKSIFRTENRDCACSLCAPGQIFSCHGTQKMAFEFFMHASASGATAGRSSFPRPSPQLLFQTKFACIGKDSSHARGFFWPCLPKDTVFLRPVRARYVVRSWKGRCRIFSWRGRPVDDFGGCMTWDGYVEFVCGAGAAATNVFVTYPANKLMFRQQLHGVRLAKAMLQLHGEGVRLLYRGVGPPLMQKTLAVSMMFGGFASFQNLLNEHGGRKYPLGTVFGAAMMAGTTEALLFTPLERIQTLLQDHRYHKRFRNMYHAFRMLSPYGLAEYYRGLVPILCRNGPSSTLFFGLREPIRDGVGRLTSQSDGAAGLARDFISGAVLGAGLSTLFYPLNVVKNKMQTRVGGDFFSLPSAVMYVFEQRGRSFRRMYRGVHINYTRSLASWGIINCTYEIMYKAFKQEH